MDILKVFRLLLKELWIIIIVTIVCALISGILSTYVIKKTYSATATVMVLQNNLYGTTTTIQNNDIQVAQQFVNTFMEIVSSPHVLDVVEKKFSKYSTSDLSRMLTVSNKLNTLILNINVKGTNAQDCKDIANAISDSFITETRDIINYDLIKKIDDAKTPTAPVSPNLMINVALAGFLGMFVTVGVIILIAYFDNTVKSEEDVAKYLELPVIGLIPMYMEDQKKWKI